MGQYSAGVLTPAAATVAPYATIAAAAALRTRIYEIGAFCNAATASSIGLYRATNTFVVTTSTLTQVEDEPTVNPAGTTIIGTAWSTAPTIGSNVPHRRAVLPAAIGAGVIWQFPQGLTVGPAGTLGLVVWNFGGSTASALNLYVVCDD